MKSPFPVFAKRYGPWLATSLAILLLLAPVLAVERLPLLDVPSHEARLVVLNQILVSGVGSPFYTLDTLLLPNVGFDLVGLLLTAAVGPLLAGPLFLGGSLVIAFTGVLALSYTVLGYRSLLPRSCSTPPAG